MTRATRPLAVLAAVLAVAVTACDGGAPGSVSVQAQDDLSFEPEQLEVAAGEVTVEMTCGEGVEHTFVVEEAGDEQVAACDPGETDSGTIQLDAGDYTFYCDVPGHREAGMEGTLTVGG